MIDKTKHKEINCEICGKKVIQNNYRQILCGDKECRRKHELNYKRLHYRDDIEKMYKKKRAEYDRNSDSYKRRSRENYEENKELRNKQNLEYVKNRYRVDESFRMRRILGTALGQVIRYYIKTGKIANPLKKYGIDWKGIVKQLSHFPKDRSKYHVDHIVPLFKFDLSDFEQIHLAFAPENHRWLKKKDNAKRSKLKRKRFSVRGQR